MSIESIIEYEFSNPALLEEALTHPSLTRDQEIKVSQNYERLEFLGDSVLGLVIADMLFQRYPDEAEGGLAKRKAALVSKKSLSVVAASLQLGDYLIMSKGEVQKGGKENASNLENALEALIGALYLDGGIDVVKKFLLTHFETMIEQMTEPPMDAKSALQEWSQKQGKPIPSYKMVSRTGSSHAPTFTIEVSVEGCEPISATGSSKKSAETKAAELLLEKIKGEQ